MRNDLIVDNSTSAMGSPIYVYQKFLRDRQNLKSDCIQQDKLFLSKLLKDERCIKMLHTKKFSKPWIVALLLNRLFSCKAQTKLFHISVTFRPYERDFHQRFFFLCCHVHMLIRQNPILRIRYYCKESIILSNDVNPYVTPQRNIYLG